MQRIYCREGQEVAIEISPGSRDGGYRLRTLWPDGRELVETFSNERGLHRRLETLERQLLALNWNRQAEPDASGGETDVRGGSAERRAGIGDRRRVTRRDRRTQSS